MESAPQLKVLLYWPVKPMGLMRTVWPAELPTWCSRLSFLWVSLHAHHDGAQGLVQPRHQSTLAGLCACMAGFDAMCGGQQGAAAWGPGP